MNLEEGYTIRVCHLYESFMCLNMFLNKFVVFAAVFVVTITIVHGDTTIHAPDFADSNSSLEKANNTDRGDPKNFPYIAHVEYPNEDDAYCIGAIIDPFWVLTTVACSQFSNPNEVTIIVGIGLKKNQNGVRYEVDRVIVGGLLSGSVRGNNRFILFKTKKAIKTNARVNVIKINEKSINSGKRALTARWQLVSAFIL